MIAYSILYIKHNPTTTATHTTTTTHPTPNTTTHPTPSTTRSAPPHRPVLYVLYAICIKPTPYVLQLCIKPTSTHLYPLLSTVYYPLSTPHRSRTLSRNTIYVLNPPRYAANLY
jgi:hypothetical protein